MDNAQKAIMIGVGLFITIIIISAVLLIVNLGTGLVDDATTELGTMSTGLQNQILQNYDNKTLSGVQVRSAIQQYLNSTDMTVVLMGKHDDEVPANSKSTTAYATVGKVKLATGIYTRGTEAYTIESTTYKDVTTGHVHKSSMQDFNKLSEVGKSYIDTSNTFESYVLKIADTKTIVGIVFVPVS